MKDRLRNMLKGAGKEGLGRTTTPEAPRAGEKPPRPRIVFRLPFLKNQREKTAKRAEGVKAEEKTRSSPLLALGFLAGAIALGTLFLVSRLGGERGPEPPTLAPPAPGPFSPSPPPVVPPVPAPTPQGGASPPLVEGLAASTHREEAPKPIAPPAPKKARNPFGDPENRASESSEVKPSPNPSARSGASPPPPAALGALPPLPPPPTGAPQGGSAPAEPPPPPEVACLAVFLGKEASAVVKAAGFEGVVSVGEEVPGVGRLIEVSPNGCVISMDGRKLKASLEGDRRWK
jgi:hypothetical protein